MAFCGNCGAALTQQAIFCGACGKHAGTANQAPVSAPATVDAGARQAEVWTQVESQPMPSQTPPPQTGWTPIAGQSSSGPVIPQSPAGSQAGYVPVSGPPATSAA